MFKIANFLFLITASLLSAQNISTKSAVIFNTLCAKCHEGECSGRLSFDTGKQAASSHIRRYAGDTNISESETKEFFTLLNYMKTECIILMPDVTMWKPDNLAHFATPSYKGYFVPLGTLKRGNYHISIETKESILFKIEVLSNQFDHFLDRSICPDEKEKIFHFKVDETVKTFLRIRSREPLHIIKLKIVKK